MRIFHLAVFVMMITTFLSAQTDSSDFHNNLETILEDLTEDKEDSQVYDLFEFLLNNPIDLNTASVSDLLQIPFLNGVTARAIIRYRNQSGGIYSKDQLYRIETVNKDLIEMIIPFLKLSDFEQTSMLDSIYHIFQNTRFNFRSRTTQDLQTRKGFANGTFLGSQQKLYNRLTFKSANKFRAGLLIEKDAGEKSINDFSSFHICINDISFIQSAVFGNYIFEFGQGLAFWSAYGFSKGSDAVGTAARNARGAVPFISSDENQFMKGAALKLSYRNFTFSPFLSSHKIDASIDTATNKISAISIDGYHRTENEIRNKDRLNEKIFGFQTEFLFNEASKISMLFYHLEYDREFLLPSLYSKSEFYSAAYMTTFNNLSVNGEFAYDKYSLASINNIEFAVDRNFSLVFSYRNFAKNYSALHGNSFGEKGTAQNENGFYTGLFWKTNFGAFNFYYDQFKFPAADENYNFPSSGNEFLIYYVCKPMDNTELKIKFKKENKEILTIIQNEYGLTKRRTQNLRAEISYFISKNLKLKTRYEIVNISSIPGSPSENGYLLFQDFSYRLFENFRLYGRIIFFRTDSYKSRLYEFENDLTGVMTNPVLYNDGSRWYFLANYKTHFGLSLSLKYSELYKPYERTIGSGYSEIQGNVDNRLSVQLDFQF